MSLNVFALEEKEFLKGTIKDKKTFSDVQYISTVTPQRYCIGLMDGFIIMSHDGVILYHEKTKQGVSVIETMSDTDTVALVGNGKEFWEYKDPNIKEEDQSYVITEDKVSELDFSEMLEKDSKDLILYRDKIVIWNVKEKKRVRLISISNVILGIRIHKEYLAVIFADGVSIHQHSGKFIQLFKTATNPNGICSIATKKNNILAIPDPEKGSIQIVELNTMEYTTFQAHDHAIELVTLSDDGKFVATASSKGTLIRIIELTTGNLIREFRRGSHACTLYSIAFSPDKKFLASTGSSGTVHLYDLESESLITDILDSLNISFQHSSAKFHGVTGKSVCVFPTHDSYSRILSVLTSGGELLQLNFVSKKNFFCEEKVAYLH